MRRFSGLPECQDARWLVMLRCGGACAQTIPHSVGNQCKRGDDPNGKHDLDGAGGADTDLGAMILMAKVVTVLLQRTSCAHAAQVAPCACRRQGDTSGNALNCQVVLRSSLVAGRPRPCGAESNEIMWSRS